MKKLLLTCVVLLIAVAGFSQQSSTNAGSGDKGKLVNSKAPENQKKTRTALKADPGFPKYVDTGNPEKDRATYQVAKQEWIRNNPEKYKAMMASEDEQKKAAQKNGGQRNVTPLKK